MGNLFDRISKTLGDLSKKVEESGLLDDVKDLVTGDDAPDDASVSSSEEALAGDAASQPPQGSASGWDGAVGRAGVDPMALLTPEDLGSALDLPFDHTYPQLEDEWFGVTWTTQENGGPYVEARFAHGYTDGSPVDVPGMWQFVIGEVGATRPVDVDDRVEARSDDLETLYVRMPGHLFYVVSGGLAEGVDIAELHRRAAAAVVRRLLG